MNNNEYKTLEKYQHLGLAQTAQARTLMWLRENPSSRVARISKEISQSQPNTNSTMKVLEKKGLVSYKLVGGVAEWSVVESKMKILFDK